MSIPTTVVQEGGHLTSLTVSGVGPAKRIELDLATRVNLLTGDNGLGKSFILECAWWALSGEWASFPAYPREEVAQTDPEISFAISSASGWRSQGKSVYDWTLRQWSMPDERPTIPGLLIYARVDGAFAVWDPARDYWTVQGQPSKQQPLILTREEVWNGLQQTVGGKTNYLTNGLINDWILWQNSPDSQPFETLKAVLWQLSPPDLQQGDLGRLEPGQPIRMARDSRWMPTIKHAYGDIPLVHASAGVRRIIALAYLIVWAWEEHKTHSKLIRRPSQQTMAILVDEIEAHLHPKWQRRILPALLQIPAALEANLQMQLLVATHSPLVMASIEPVFDNETDKIFHLNLIKQDLFAAEVTAEAVDFVLYGSVDSWLRSELFELAHARSEEAEAAIEEAKQLQMRDSDEVTQAEVAALSQRLVKYLAAHDQFWPRWTFFAEQHGVDL